MVACVRVRGCAEPFGCCPRGSGLGGVPLGLAEVGDRFGQRGQPYQQRDDG